MCITPNVYTYGGIVAEDSPRVESSPSLSMPRNGFLVRVARDLQARYRDVESLKDATFGCRGRWA